MRDSSCLPEGILREIQRLAPLPLTAQRLMATLNDEEVPFEEVVGAVEHDQAMVSNILKMANSAAFGGRTEISNLRLALVRLGSERILELALGSYLRGVSIKAPMYDLTEEDLWAHSVASYLSILEISKMKPAAAIPEIAALAGLLHDIGKLIMVRYLGIDVAELISTSEREQICFVEAERVVCGFDHAAVGGAVARIWDFPDEVRTAIENHHKADLEEPNPVLDAVIVSNLVAKTIGAGVGAEGMNFEVDEDCPARLGLDYHDFCHVCMQTSFRLRNLQDLYQTVQ